MTQTKPWQQWWSGASQTLSDWKDYTIGSNMYSETSKKAEGRKDDSGKPEIEMVDPEFLEGLAKVLMFGKEKYARNNWRNGINISRLISSTYRHLGEINKNNTLDEESGLPHVYHLACCVMFLAWTLKNKPEMDDRWKQ